MITFRSLSFGELQNHAAPQHSHHLTTWQVGKLSSSALLPSLKKITAELDCRSAAETPRLWFFCTDVLSQLMSQSGEAAPYRDCRVRGDDPYEILGTVVLRFSYVFERMDECVACISTLHCVRFRPAHRRYSFSAREQSNIYAALPLLHKSGQLNFVPGLSCEF